MSKVTMKDIAKKAGVSKATVSRVINNSSHVSKKIRNKVMALVKEYNYKPHTVARGLAQNLSHTIGLMLPGPPRDITDPFFLEFLHGVTDKLTEYDYSLSVPTISKREEKKLYEEKINFDRLDGVIVIAPRVDDFRIKYLKQEDIPFVFLGRPANKDEDICWVDGANFDGAYQAVDFLIGQGHRKIAYLTGPSDFVVSELRLNGYKQALRDNNIEFNSNLIIESDFTKTDGYNKTNRLLDSEISFSALFSSNDSMAIGAIRALNENNIFIPQDCAVMGFDGIDLGAYIEPSLTTIKQPTYELGVEVVKSLIKLIRGQTNFAKSKELELELLVRDSV